jgi:hypothetical protein
MEMHKGTKHRSLAKLLIVAGFIGLMIFGFRLARSRQPLLRNETWFSRFESPDRKSNQPDELTQHGSPVAEIEYRSQIELDTTQSSNSKPDGSLLPVDRPAWVAAPDDTTTELHRIGVSSELESSLIAARASLDSSLVDHVRKYIDRQQPPRAKPVAAKLDRLNAEWIKQNLAVDAPEYEAVLERPSGTYHQVWTQLTIDSDDRSIIQTWIDQLEARIRAGKISALFVGFVGLTVIFHSFLKVLARRTEYKSG